MTELQLQIYIVIGNYIHTGVLMLLPFYLLTFRGKNRILGFWGVTTISLGFFCLCNHLFATTWMVRIVKITLNYTWFLTCIMLFFRDSRKRRLIVGISSIVLLEIAEILTISLVSLICPVEYSRGSEYSEAGMRAIIFINIILFILYVYYILFWKRVVDKCRVHGMLLYFVVPVYHLVLLVMFFDRAEKFSVKTAVLGLCMLVMGMLITIVMLYFLQNMEQKLEVEERLSGLYRQRQYELEYYQGINRHLEELRKVRHDFINMIQTVYLLIQNGSSAETARELLDQAYGELEHTRIVRYCENPVVNALISIKEEKAVQNGITFDVECSLGDVEGMEEIDLCSLFGNMLDNALEACVQIPEEKPRRLELKAFEKGGYQVIRTCNTYLPSSRKGDFFHSSKEDQLNHGYGLKLIERICRKYGGELRTSVTQDEVLVTVYLSLERTGLPGNHEITKDGK